MPNPTDVADCTTGLTDDDDDVDDAAAEEDTVDETAEADGCDCGVVFVPDAGFASAL
jgi:hypothetical protein